MVTTAIRLKFQPIVTMFAAMLLFFCSFFCSANTDTTFIGKTRAIVQFRDTGYSNFTRKIYIEKSKAGWNQAADSVFYNDGKIFRTRAFYPLIVPCSVDTFFIASVEGVTSGIGAITLNIGKISFRQEMDAFGIVKKIYVRNTARNLPSFEVDLTVDHPEVDRPQLFFELDPVTKRIASVRFKYLFNTLYFFDSRVKMPADLWFPENAPPFFR